MNTVPPLSPAAAVLQGSYETLWSSFADATRRWTDQVKKWAEGQDDLHALLGQIQWTPKGWLQAAVWVDEDTPNIGSATGLFFEHVASAAIEARIRSRVSGSVSHRNRLGTHVAGEGARKQPDLILVNDATGRSVVFEFKTSPKSDQLDAIREQQKSWQKNSNVRFFLVAGYADGTVATTLASDDWTWASVLRHNGTAGRSVDALVRDAINHLSGPIP